MAVQPTGEEVQLAQVVTPPPPAALVASLPATASSLPLIAFLGLLALGGAFVIRSAEKRAL
jgi:LPXTG-motif cell wall-anchored protein